MLAVMKKTIYIVILLCLSSCVRAENNISEKRDQGLDLATVHPCWPKSNAEEKLIAESIGWLKSKPKTYSDVSQWPRYETIISAIFALPPIVCVKISFEIEPEANNVSNATVEKISYPKETTGYSAFQKSALRRVYGFEALPLKEHRYGMIIFYYENPVFEEYISSSMNRLPSKIDNRDIVKLDKE